MYCGSFMSFLNASRWCSCQWKDQKLFRLSVIQMCNGIAYWYSPAGPASLRAIADQIAGFALAMAGSGYPSDASTPAAEADAEEVG